MHTAQPNLAPPGLTFDHKIVGGLLLDGTGAPARRADLGVRGDRIAALGDLTAAAARRTWRADGRYVCPGFIDAHSHSDAYLLIEPSAPSKIYQGITTEIVGNCGASASPLIRRDCLPSDWQAHPYPGEWKTTAEYVALLERVRPAPNVMLLIGHGKLRAWVVGLENRAATPDELRAMERLLDQCLAEGGRGLSTGLIYAPGLFASREELVALAHVAARHDGLYTTHMRSESGHLLEALEEAIAIGRASGARVEISHLKTAGRAHWPLLDRALDLIRAARAEGLAIAADRYPYTSANTDLDVIFPDWAVTGGRDAVLRRLHDPADRQRLRDELTASRTPDYWETVTIGSTSHPDNTRFRGRPLSEVAAELRLPPAEAALLLIERDALRTSAFFFGMSEDNMWKILAEPFVMLGTDASLRAPTGPLGEDHPHPRAYGSFPRFLRAALDGKTVPLPEAVRKMTSLPADHFRLKDRGRLTAGGMADLIVFDPTTVSDRATYAAPHQLAVGLELVMVNGVVTLEPAGLTGQRAGRVL